MAQDFFVRKTYSQDNKSLFCVTVFVLFQMSHKQLKKPQMYLLNIQFYPFICVVCNKTVWKVTGTLVKCISKLTMLEQYFFHYLKFGFDPQFNLSGSAP